MNIIEEKKCARCGYEWFPKTTKEPKRCARCNSPNWKTKKKVPKYLEEK